MKELYDKSNRRLIFIGESASPEFWDKLYNTEKLRDILEQGKNDRFNLRILAKYFPDKKGRILEGGCGYGRVVYCMHIHGYESVGVDSAQETIGKIKKLFPELDVRVGDVSNLQFPDNYFIGYWSIGVIEHFWRGYRQVLKEIRRVLAGGGYLFLSFPYMSPLRKFKANLGLYQAFDGENIESFYQFALDRDTVVQDFRENGFVLVEEKSLGGVKGFKDEFNIFKPWLQKLASYRGSNLLVRVFKYALDVSLAVFAGHTKFLVFRNVK